MLGDGINDTTALAGMLPVAEAVLSPPGLHDRILSCFSILICILMCCCCCPAADVGVAMGAAGSAMAVKAADVVLMTESLTKLPSTIAMGKLTRLLIYENVVFSVAVKLMAIVLALTGYLMLWHAILIDIGTLFVVIANGTRPLFSQVCASFP